MTTIGPKLKISNWISEQITEHRVKVFVLCNFSDRKVGGM